MSKKFLTAILIFIFSFVFNLSAENNQKIESIKKEYEYLKQWEKELKEKEDRLKKIELDIVAKKEQLKEIKQEISKIYNQIKEIKEAQIKDLAIIYSKMKPEESSQIINKMDVELAVKIFLKMQPNKIAKILNLVDKDKVVKITEKLALFGIKINLGGNK